MCEKSTWRGQIRSNNARGFSVMAASARYHGQAGRGLLTLANPYVTTTIEIQGSPSIMYVKPGTGGETPQMPTGGGRFETRVYVLEITTEFHSLRAQSRQIERYRRWHQALVTELHKWFEGRTG